MSEPKINLLFSSEITDAFEASPINGTRAKGTYNPMQFVLRLRKDVHEAMDTIEPGIQTRELTFEEVQAFSTYLHENIHWWQHVGSNFGFISSLRFPAQAHVAYNDLRGLLKDHGAFKSIMDYDRISTFVEKLEGNAHVNRILNNWYDLEAAYAISFDPKLAQRYANNPYFDCVGHSYYIMWSAAIMCLATTIDKSFHFLPKLENWASGFQKLRDEKVEGFYFGSRIGVPPFGIRAIYEGQARFSQLQYLYCNSRGTCTFNDFVKAGMLNGIYIEAFNTLESKFFNITVSRKRGEKHQRT